ncbi:MAG TPA: serine/threonine-protein kinase [Gemmatimonadaceae bacterium]|nr:serine/threonine-protein kinase [Gemmatimonadaceae bacterium]
MTVLEIPTPDPRTLDDASRPFAEAIARHYAIKRMIGRGGMGIVYLARDRRLDRLVAIKTLPPELATDRSVRERFVREARTAGALNHPNIVPVHGADEIDDHVFFVMAYVDGESLAAHVRARAPLPPAVAAGYLRDVATALAHAHRRGVVHRDIKAENILVDAASDRAMVTDFGIARVAEAAPLTATGQLLGTVYYVSPEQVAGNPVDARSDLYSLGVVGFLALTGHFPFEGEVASAVLVAHVTTPAPPLATVQPSVPPALAAIVDRCLAKSPADRFASADELLAALDAAIAALEQPPKAAARPAFVSDTEAQAVWRRAAELQEATGVRTNPLPVPHARETRRRRRARGVGFDVDEVRAAAAEAGIATRFVEHALIEQGLLPPPLIPGRVHEGPAARGWQSGTAWAGAPLDIVMEVEADGELPPRELDRLVTTLREGTASLGAVSATARGLVWRGGWTGHRLEVAVTPDQGRTRIRLVQSLRRAAVGTTALAVGIGAAAAPAVGVALDLLLNIPAPSWSVALRSDTIAGIAGTIGVAAGLSAIPVARALVRRLRRFNAARLQTLAELLAAKVREGATDD